MVSATPRLLYLRERALVPIDQEAAWAPGSVLNERGEEKTPRSYQDLNPELPKP